ncbi:SseB family protein [Nocardioides sp. CFH 31398]|uniref:SseB family protein n=1 Tax=Nocardioides sp. CFH 31398 TaxID=2919579 RepID=UPI001F06B44F|nr:SseB family protein [Nocardioides sp. CFH 31398]MCH1868966.1 SseB family protein [Nocardioides sp. CFH 31398]
MRDIPDPGFAGDDGAADPALLATLAAAGTDPAAALAALGTSRLLVPVTAVAGEVETGPDGLAREKDSDMAVVLMRGRDGRLALLAFSGTESLARWDPGARPVPVAGRTAARAAREDDAEALVVDVAGPTPYVVEGDDLVGLAEGWRPVRVAGGHGWIAPAGE